MEIQIYKREATADLGSSLSSDQMIRRSVADGTTVSEIRIKSKKRITNFHSIADLIKQDHQLNSGESINDDVSTDVNEVDVVDTNERYSEIMDL